MAAPDTVLHLVETFATHRDHYRSSGYNETEVRREFLDPLFKSLGWDIDNEAGYADAYKDVIHEDAIKIGGYTKAPDYCFRIGGQRKFFLEAKKPAIDIKDDTVPAYQLRRYAWSAKLPLSVLSDFEELAVYDCRVRPKPGDKASTARTLYFGFEQYADRWDELAAIFSREAVLKGSFDKYAETAKKKRGTAEVDDAFLEEIERWRDLLARNFALRNPALTVRDLNFAVQKTIDRLIFLRICEDRGTEDYGRLTKLQNGPNTYPRLLEEFRRADDRYNSGLFHFRAERDRAGAPDTLTPDLTVDDKVIKDIVKHLYYPDSPYEFSVLPADILGQVYEQFLGKTIRLTSGHQAKIEEKPEVRKAGGVYYTPKYIVDYIVENTLGRLLNGPDPDNPNPIPVSRAEKIKVVDPACGSGSFLIVAYQYLLDWHRDQYSLDAETREEDAGKIKRHSGGKSPKIYQAKGGEWKLTTAERKRILLNNIHGVDIDSQAVEVTKLSLLLKVLEGETQQNLQRDFLKERQRILPDLGHNIRCGNSLIGPDFYDQPDLPDLDDETRYRINVFDWHDAFPKVSAKGGFDCVIGNPPYLRIQGLRSHYEEQIPYFKSRYDSASKRFDFYMLFLEKGFTLLREHGKLGYICPHKFLIGDFASTLREFLIRERAIEQIVSLGHNLVFSSASTYTGVFILSKMGQERFRFAQIPELPAAELQSALPCSSEPEAFALYSFSNLDSSPWTLSSRANQLLFEKITSRPDTVGTVFSDVMVGTQTGIDDVHVLDKPAEEKGGVLSAWSEREGKRISIEKGIAKPFAFGEEVHRYQPVSPRRLCIYPYQLSGERTRILPEEQLQSEFPSAFAYLARHREYLREIRVRQRTNPRYWYSCHRSKDMGVFERKRLITPEISKGCNFTIGPPGLYHNTKVYSLVPKESQRESLSYWLGVLNNPLMWWFLQLTGTVFRGGYFCFKTNYLRPFPVPIIDFSVPSEVEKHDQIVSLVDRMLTLHDRKEVEKNPDTLRHLEAEITATDRRIDRLVYELYNLTDEEIALVEEA